MKIIDFIKELYATVYDNGSEQSDEVHTLDLDLKDLWDSLRNKWGFLDHCALDIDQTAEDYDSRTNMWKNIVEDSKALSDLDFVLKHGEDYLTWMHKDGELDTEAINFEKNRVLKKPYPIALELDDKFLDWDGQKIYSFKIHEEYPFRINLHVKHEKRIFHELLIFFSVSVENPVKKAFSMEFINNFYRALVSSYEVTHYLKAEDYRNTLAQIQDYAITEVYEPNYKFMDYLKAEPFMFSVHYLDLIGSSLDSLLALLSSHLRKILDLIAKFELIHRPLEYYSIFGKEVENFIDQGKHMFLKAQDLLYSEKNNQKKSSKKQEKKPGLKEITLVKLFQLEYDHDIEQKSDPSNAGYRSLPTIYKKYEKKLGISWKTFNDKAVGIIERSPRFEDRKRMKSGGGKEFRVILPDFILLREKKTEDLQIGNFKGEKYEVLLDYEQAKMLHEDGKVGTAVNTFEKLLSSYSEKLVSYSYVYCDICYRLGLIYERYGYLDDAERVYKTGQQNFALSGKRYYWFKIGLLKNELLRGSYQKLQDKIIEKENTIKKFLKQDLEELNLNYQYIEGTNLEDLDIVYIRDLKRDSEYSRNPVFQEVVQLDLDLMHLQVLKLDLLRREFYRESLYKLEIDAQRDEIYFKQYLSESMQVILDKSKKIVEKLKNNTFNFGNRSFVLVRLYKSFFEESHFDDRGFDYGAIPDTFFPEYYTKFLFDVANYTTLTDRHIFERLDKKEFVSLDRESQVEYLLKFCVSNWRPSAFGARGYPKINVYINMNTLLEHASFLVDKYKLVQFNEVIKKVQPWLKQVVEDFITNYSKIAERLKNREVRKL